MVVRGAVDSLKNFVIEKPCPVCVVREEKYKDAYAYLREEITFLREQLKREQERNKELEVELKFSEPKVEELEYKRPTREQERHLRIQGVSSPMKQRMAAEQASRKKHWANKVNELPELPDSVNTGITNAN